MFFVPVYIGEVMAKKKGGVELIALQCADCKRKNYTSQKNRRNVQGKLELKKYCKWCKTSTVHKEANIK
jgi:large subunit ribosomal protein L33